MMVCIIYIRIKGMRSYIDGVSEPSSVSSQLHLRISYANTSHSIGVIESTLEAAADNESEEDDSSHDSHQDPS